jgi:transcriptional regulator with XRE-family HTH domain
MAQTRLKQLREEAVLTVHELSEASGVSDDTISKIENGQRVARPSTLRKLAQVLNVSPQELRRPAKTEELAGAGKVEAPATGPQLVIDLVLDAAEKQATADRQAIARAGSSGRPQASTVRYENEALRSLLEHPHGVIAEALVDLARRFVQVEQENAQLRELATLQERQRAYQE